LFADVHNGGVMKINSYLMVAVFGSQEIEKWIDASCEKDARKQFWNGLSDSQKNAVEEIDCVDVQY
jgi:hypothetical protein